MIRLLKFQGADPYAGESVEAVRKLELALQGLGKDGVLCNEANEATAKASDRMIDLLWGSP